MTGILLVILAHVNISALVKNIRTFDVTLLIMVSGMSLYYGKDVAFKDYLKRRTGQLVIPAYITITMAVILNMSGSFIFPEIDRFGTEKILRTYLLVDGIGYVWIIRVFLMIMVVSPAVKMVERRIKSNAGVFFILLLIWAADSAAFYLFGNSSMLLRITVLYLLPYTAVVLAGLRCVRSPSFFKYLIPVCFAAAAAATFLNGGFLPDEGKYPPGIYYISYGVLMTSILYLVFDRAVFPAFMDRAACWVSTYSYTLYLVHIIVILIIQWSCQITKSAILQAWWFQYAVTLAASLCITYLIENSKALFGRKRNEDGFH